MENDNYSIHFSLSNETLENLKAQKVSPEIKKENVETVYESVKSSPVNAVYTSDDKSAEIRYTSGDNGVKETIILNEKPENNVFTYVLKLKNMIPKKNPTDEGITFYDKSGEEIKGAIDAPWMNDANGDSYSENITYDIEASDGNEDEYILTMTVDDGYLASKNRKYPVTIDPTTTWKGNDKLRDVYVISGTKYEGENFYAAGTNVMPAGKNSTGTHQTYIKFISDHTVMIS